MYRVLVKVILFASILDFGSKLIDSNGGVSNYKNQIFVTSCRLLSVNWRPLTLFP